METSDQLSSLERSAYRSTYSDGIIDIFFGVSLVFIGAVWIWAEDLAGLAGILPAAMASSVLPIFLYSAALVVGGTLAARVEANPGWPLLGAGLIIVAVGGVMLVRYLEANPAIDGS